MDIIYRDIEFADREVDVSRREVTAYAAVFDRTAEIRDIHGHYLESIDATAFNRTLDHARGDLSRIKVLFNHGRGLDGKPAERFAMPIGRPLEITADPTGLRTVTRISETPLGDEVLTLVRDGAVTGYSFTGRIVSRDTPDTSGPLPHIHRTEIGLTEYGPGVFPSYADAKVLAVRSDDPVDTLDHSTERTDQTRRPRVGTPVDRRRITTRVRLYPI